MRRKIVQYALILLVLLSVIPPNAAAEGETTLRAGLFYDSEALPSANLKNEVGSGYRFGYFDASQVFYQVGYSADIEITMLKTQNMYMSGGKYSESPSGGVTAVGCYHLQVGGTYDSFESARDAASQYSGGFPAWVSGSYTVRVGTYESSAAAAAAQGGLGASTTVVGTSSNGITVVKTKTAEVLFQFDGGDSISLAVRPGLDDSVKTVTWFKGYQYYGSFQYQRRGGGNITVVNFVPLEDYVKGVLPYEMPGNSPLEAYKAQAVCARTYAIRSQNKHSKLGFDVCNTTDCQVYRGVNTSTPVTDQAVDETAGQYVWYNGKMAETYYSSHNGGASESVWNVWGNGGDLPYLKGVVDPYEASVIDKIDNYNWTVTFTKAELTEKLRSKNFMCADIVDFYVAETTPTGNVFKITFVDANGKSWSFVNTNKEYCRTLLGLRSSRYTVSGSGGVSFYVNDSTTTIPSISGAYAVDGTGAVAQVSGSPNAVTGSGNEQLTSGARGDSFTVKGSGWGHSVGLSQWGAYAMGLQGKSYIEILQFYYTGVEVR